MDVGVEKQVRTDKPTDKSSGLDMSDVCSPGGWSSST
jgi:hypothetical protein